MKAVEYDIYYAHSTLKIAYKLQSSQTPRRMTRSL